MNIDITNLSRAAILAALHNGTRPVGLGHFHDIHANMSESEAQEFLDECKELGGHVYLDYVFGRPVKVHFKGNVLERADLYDRDCPTGEGSCARIVEQVRVDYAKKKQRAAVKEAEAELERKRVLAEEQGDEDDESDDPEEPMKSGLVESFPVQTHATEPANQAAPYVEPTPEVSAPEVHRSDLANDPGHHSHFSSDPGHHGGSHDSGSSFDGGSSDGGGSSSND